MVRVAVMTSITPAALIVMARSCVPGLAVVIFQPWRYETPLGQSVPPGNTTQTIELASARPTVAQLVAATGQVDVVFDDGCQVRAL